ncbi:MAG: YicC family protein [Gammaproteobacteria bacterium]|nr:YicC family protein [Gammaproteobacteria bacterium]
MLKSMTAFARTEQQYEFGTLSWELRSVNHRYLDVNLRLPEELRGLEQVLREKVAEKLNRGKLDGNLRFRLSADVAVPVMIDKGYAEKVVQACREIESLLDTTSTVDPLAVLRWPGVVKEVERDITPLEKAAVAQLYQTLDELIETRQREGQRILEMLEQRCSKIAMLVAEVRDRRPQVLASIRGKIESRLAELPVKVDQDRFEQELVLITQRMDVDEELDRLDAHIAEIQDVLKRDMAVGRRLDFLMQELNREANTLSSKSADTETTRAAVDLKVLIEQMREQIQNIE